ncbi:hypothetical protein ACOSP7_010356 [Xanthoceras sorbifolium]
MRLMQLKEEEETNPKFNATAARNMGILHGIATRNSVNYCKKNDHIIKECPIRPQNKQTKSFHAALQTQPEASDHSHNVATMSTGSAGVTQPGLIPEMVQQMIKLAFSAFGLQGKGLKLTSPLFMDSGASNHMTGSTDMLHGIRKYEGGQHI